MIYWLPLLLALAFAAPAAAAPCTDGVDCYCDCVAGPATIGNFKNASCASRNGGVGVAVDASVVMCEDFEAATLTQNVNMGGGAPLWGPWGDSTSLGIQPCTFFSNWRGCNSYWSRNYGQATGCGWVGPDDPSPLPAGTGPACNPGGSGICYCKEWSAGDPWGGQDDNSAGKNRAIIDIMRDGEFDDSESTIEDPLIPGGGSGVFDGQQILAQRTPQGEGQPFTNANTAGFHGTKTFDNQQTEIGFTMALAYPSNVLASGMITDYYKHDEWGPANDMPFIGNVPIIEGLLVGGGMHMFPYAPTLFGSNCPAAIAGATQHVGQVVCSGGALLRFGPANYTQETDFPYGTWGCPQGHITGLGTSNVTLKVWHNGTLVIHVSGINGTLLQDQYLSAYKFNNFTNHNQDSTGGQLTEYDSYRFEDNIHIRAGEPVTCEELGFSFGSVEPSPGTLNLSSATYSVNENGGTVTITVARTGGTDGQVTASVVPSAGTAAVYTDYSPEAPLVTFDDGESTSQTATIPIENDALDELNETFTVTLVNGTGGATIGATDDATVTITDNDDAPTMSISDLTETEGDIGSSTSQSVVTLSTASGREVTVSVASSDTTTTAGEDYTAVSATTLTFPAGVTSKVVNVAILGDTTDEAAETYALTLSSENGATLADGTAVGTITDNDQPPSVRLSASHAEISEDGGVSTVTATLSAASGQTVTTSLAFSGTATGGGTDYTASGSSIAINAGSTTGTRTLTAVADASDEDPNETIIAAISGTPINGTVGDPSGVVVTILGVDVDPTVGAWGSVWRSAWISAH